MLRARRYSRNSGRWRFRLVARGGARSVLKERGPGLWPRAPLSVCRKSGASHFFEVFIAPLRLRRGQGAMQGNPCYARLFADLTRTPQGAFSCPFGTIHLVSPNPIKASGGCGPRTPRGFFDKLGAARRAAPLAAKRRRPPHVRPFLPALPSNRRMAGGGALAKGRGETLGHAGGRRRFAGPGGPQNQSMGGGQRSPPMLCARCARPPPRRERCDFPPLKRFIRQPFPPRLPTNKTSPPLPMSGGPA